MTTSKKHLKILTELTIAGRRAVDALHDQYLTRSYPIDSDKFMENVRRDMEQALAHRLKGKETLLKQQIQYLIEKLLGHIYVSHWMLHQAYSHQEHTKTGVHIHCDLVHEARERAERALEGYLEAAIGVVSGEGDKHSLFSVRFTS